LEKSYIVSEVLTDRRPDNIKCPLSLLQHDMLRFASGEYEQLPRLADLKTKYPGDKFTRLKGSWCDNRYPFCAGLAAQGSCNGTNTEFEKFISARTNETFLIESTGFRARKLEDVHPGQIEEMAIKCRPACQKSMQDIRLEEQSEMVQVAGGYKDIIIDNVGVARNICSFEEGWEPKSADRALGVLLISHLQSPHLPKFHPVGFEKMKIPKDMYARILNNRKKLFNSGKKWNIEKCDYGMQNCQKILESKEAQECHLVSAENYWYMGLGTAVKEEVYERLRVAGQDWIGNVVELAGTSIYGIRRYTRGAWLLGHLDHLRTHVISAILNIKQKVDSDWPLQIYDHAGRLHEVTLKEGEMVWYESAKMVHARAVPLNGSYFENIFVHYMPRSRSWFKKDFSVQYGDPVSPITLQSLQQADLEMKVMKQELREQVSREKQMFAQHDSTFHIGHPQP